MEWSISSRTEQMMQVAPWVGEGKEFGGGRPEVISALAELDS